jgi:hypothetical protein
MLFLRILIKKLNYLGKLLRNGNGTNIGEITEVRFIFNVFIVQSMSDPWI